MWKWQFIPVSAPVPWFTERARSIASRYQNGPAVSPVDTRTLTAVDYLLFSDTTRSSNSLHQAGRPTSNRLSDRDMTPSCGRNFPVRHHAWPVLGPTQPFLWSPDALSQGKSCQETRLISHLLHELMLPITFTHIKELVTRDWGLRQGTTNFPKIYQPPPNCRRRKGDMKYMPYSGYTVLGWPVSFNVIWRLLLRACEMMYIFYMQGKLKL